MRGIRNGNQYASLSLNCVLTSIRTLQQVREIKKGESRGGHLQTSGKIALEPTAGRI